MQREKTILPFHNDPSQEGTAREARRKRKREQAREIEQAREYLKSPSPQTLTPQAVYHWDREDQIKALVTARQDGPDVGFMARLLALCTLPRTNPGDRKEYKRVNGPFELYLIAGGGMKLPYGTLPRLLLAWICTEAVRTQSRVLVLGASLSAFMRKLDIDPSGGGKRGDRTRLRNQMQRLFRATVQLTHQDTRGSHAVTSPIASEVTLWWDPGRADESVLWDSTIELGEKFFAEIIACPVPLDMNVLKGMKRSPLGLDIYLWLTYRMFGLKSPLRLSWRQLYRQFGSTANTDKLTVKNFRKDVIRELRKLRTAWPELSYRLPAGFLELRPTPPRIAERKTDAGK